MIKMATTCEHPGYISNWYLVEPVAKTGIAGGALALEEAVFRAVRYPGREVAARFIWNLQESSGLKMEIGEASDFKEELKA